MKQSQEQWVIDRLLQTGEVSRNGALQNYISRLGAIIFNLKQNGWEIKGEWRKEEHGKDFVYYRVVSPHRKVVYNVPELDKEIITYK
jgi:hypothetical protein